MTGAAYLGGVEFHDRSGVLVLRAWMQDGRLHARILSSQDAGKDRRTCAAVGRRAIEAHVAEWLAELAETES